MSLTRYYFGIFITCFTLLLILSSKVKAQQYSISGILTDSTNRALNGVEIQLLTASTSHSEQKAISNIDGAFVFQKLTSGDFVLEVTSVVYAPMSISVRIDAANVNIGKLKLLPRSHVLKEVVVEGQLPVIEQEVDRTVYNVERSTSLAGATALDAIGKVPGVRVNNSEGISLVGKGQVSILINDRQLFLSGDDLTNYLKSLSVNDISRIEVLPTPPAKYDAAGNFGLINIVTKKKVKAGLSGNLFATYLQAYYGSKNVGGSLAANQGKWSTNSSLTFTDNAYNELTNPITYYPTQTWDQNRKSKNLTNSLLGRVGIDYQLTKTRLFGLRYTISLRDIDALESSTTRVYPSPVQLDSVLIAANRIQKNAHSHNVNLHYEDQLDSLGRKYSLDGGYFIFDNNISQRANNKTFSDNDRLLNNYNLLSKAPLRVTAYTLQTDWSWPVKFVRLTAGAKISYIKNETSAQYYTPQTNGEFQVDSTMSNRFNYSENVQAGYISGTKQVGKWDYQIGIRIENTQTTGISFNYKQRNINNYFKIFPTLFVTYKGSNKHVYSFAYSKRINRPSYWYLNPFRQYVSPYFYYEGNPFLQPSFNNSFQVSYTINPMFTTRIYLDVLNNVFDQIILPDTDTKVAKLTRLNYYDQKNIGFTQLINIDQIKWMESYNSVSVYYITTKSYTDLATGRQGWGADISSNNTFFFDDKKTLMASSDFSYTFPQVSGIARFKSYYSVGFGIKKMLLEKKLTIAVNTTDIFRTSLVRFSSTTNSITTKYRNYFDNRAVRLSLSYAIGATNKPARQSKESNADESRRAN